MKLLAIDPGTTHSGMVVYDTVARQVLDYGKLDNRQLVSDITDMHLEADKPAHLACEMVGCYGQQAGRSLFMTCVWVGRFIEAWDGPYNLILRRGRWGPEPETTGAEGRFDGVTMCLCGSARVTDANVRQAIIDRFPATGGGKTPQIGLKAQPGPLFGVRKDAWSALAVALTFAEALRDCPSLATPLSGDEPFAAP